ncbi:MAG: hypothetical protein FWE40_09825 [Oscillospiraceae bacterium]|nr:hypothetical protein [Oscillospiraceae bacterium]
MQEPILTLHAAHDYETYVAFYKASLSRWAGTVAFALLSAASLVGAIATGDVAPLIISIGFALLAMFWVYYALAQPNLRKLKKQLEEKPPTSETFSFSEEHIEHSGKSELVKSSSAVLQYDYYLSAWELPAFFTLNPPAGAVILFAKRDMTEQQQQALRELFSRKFKSKFTIRKHLPSKIR